MSTKLFLHNYNVMTASSTVNTPQKEESMNLISQPPERIKYTYELEELQLTNTCGVSSGHDQCMASMCGHWVCSLGVALNDDQWLMCV